MNILIINGPNLNLLGSREPEIYGSLSFEKYLTDLQLKFREHQIEYLQSNVEGELINFIQQAMGKTDVILLNAGGYTHTSVAIADAISSINIPVIEVHISQTAARESFRHVSLIAKNCLATVSGFGLASYDAAIAGFLTAQRINSDKIN